MLTTRSRVPIRAIYSCVHANALSLRLDVLCPSALGTKSLDACAGCPVARAMRLGSCSRASFVTCEPPLTEIPSSIEDAVPDASAALPGVELRVVPELQVADVSRCIDVLGVAAAAVVDEGQHAIGVIGPTTLLRACARRVAPNGHREELASAIMEPVTLTLPSHTPLPQAAAAMAYEEASIACIVGGSGELIGLLTPIDVLRSLSATSGYLLRGDEALLVRRLAHRAGGMQMRMQ